MSTLWTLLAAAAVPVATAIAAMRWSTDAPALWDTTLPPGRP